MFSDLVIEFALVSASAQKAAHSRRAAAQPGFSPCAHDSFLVSSRYLISRSGFSFPFQPQHAANHAGNSLPVFRFQIELLLPAVCNGINLRFFGLSTGGYHLSFGMSIGIRRLQCLDLASKVSPELSANRRFNASRAATFAA